jgi:predicted urease superfamily metal-dependent hydrolase
VKRALVRGVEENDPDMLEKAIRDAKGIQRDLDLPSYCVNEMQAAELKKLLELTGADTKKFLQHYRANSVDEMLAINYSKALSALQSKVK